MSDPFAEILKKELELRHPTPPTKAEKLVAEMDAETKKFLDFSASAVAENPDVGENSTSSPSAPSGWNPEIEKEWVELSSEIRTLQTQLSKIRNTTNIRVNRLRGEQRNLVREKITKLKPRFFELETLRLAEQSRSSPKKE